MSALTLADVATADSAIFHRAAAAWKALATGIDHAAEGLARSNRLLPEAWPEGEAANAALARGTELYAATAAAYRPAMIIGNALEHHAYALIGLRELALNIINEAQRKGYGIDMATGLVTAPPIHDTDEATRSAEYARGCNSYAEQLASVLSRAYGLDDVTAATIGRNLPDSISGFGTTTLSPFVLREAVAGMHGRDPTDVNAWWTGLTPQQHDQALRDYPDLLGNMDGIPIADRDTANRAALHRDVADLTNRHDAMTQLREACLKQGTTQAAAVDAQLAAVDAKLHGLDQIATRIDDPTKPKAFLVGLSTDGDGKAIVAIGNPDKANNVLTFVPGTGADVTHTRGDIDRADRMAADAASTDPSASSSTIMWLGYDAPDDLGDAAEDDAADGAVSDLHRFQDGLRTTHEGPAQSHNVLLGHSYGTTVIGHTMKQAGVDVDDVVFVASPGVGVDSASELKGVDASHIWTTRAEGDPIEYVAGIDSSVGHGADPTDPDFGGRSFTSDPGGHSDYWGRNADDLTKARANIAEILTGNDRVK